MCVFCMTIYHSFIWKAQKLCTLQLIKSVRFGRYQINLRTLSSLEFIVKITFNVIGISLAMILPEQNAPNPGLARRRSACQCVCIVDILSLPLLPCETDYLELKGIQFLLITVTALGMNNKRKPKFMTVLKHIWKHFYHGNV